MNIYGFGPSRTMGYYSPGMVQNSNAYVPFNTTFLAQGQSSPMEAALLRSVMAILNMLSSGAPSTPTFGPANPRPLTLEAGGPQAGVSDETRALFPHFGNTIRTSNQSDIQYAESVLQTGARDWDGDGKISRQDKIKTVEFFRATRLGRAQTNDLNGDGKVTTDERKRIKEYQALSQAMNAAFPGGRTEATYQIFGFRQK